MPKAAKILTPRPVAGSLGKFPPATALERAGALWVGVGFRAHPLWWHDKPANVTTLRRPRSACSVAMGCTL